MASITYNGLDFSTIGFTLSRDSFPQPQEPRFNSYNLTSANGSILQNTSWANQSITVNGVLVGSSFSDKVAKYRKMLTYLYATSYQSLVFSKEPAIEFLCKLATAPEVNTLSEIAMEVKLEFVSQGGRDVSATVASGTVGAIVCDCEDSTFYSYPLIELTGLTPGVSLITIGAPSFGSEMWVQNWPAATLTVNCTPGERMISEGVTPRMEYLVDASEFPVLLAYSAAQTITIAVSSGTAATDITFRQVYL